MFLEQLADQWESLSAYHAGIKYFMLGQPEVLAGDGQAQNRVSSKRTIQHPPQPTTPPAPPAPHHKPTNRTTALYASMAGYFY